MAPAHGRLLDVIDVPSALDPSTAKAVKGGEEQKAFSPDTSNGGGNGGTCAAAAKHAREGTTYGCLGAPASRLRAGTGSDATKNDEVSANTATCSTEVGVYTYDRFSSCLGNGQVTYTLYEVVDGVPEVIGTALLKVTATMQLNQTSAAWQEALSVTMESASATIPSLNVSLTAACAAPCTASDPTPWAGAPSMVTGSALSGSVGFADAPAAGLSDSFKTSYTMVVTQPGVTPTDPEVNWTHPVNIRCDNAVGAYPGCVFPSAQADLVLPISQYDAAAVTYYWAQIALPDSWGDGTPLRRLASASAAESNRRATCEDGTFVPFDDDVVEDDSCDEFPFAGTVEGGTVGALCADIVPLFEDGQWYIYEASASKPVTYQEPCVRGHVPLTFNSAAGGKYGSFVQTDRVLDSESFSVTITD
ncbi:hypothetical protein ACYF6T_44110 [Streptomyces sp. 7R007]